MQGCTKNKLHIVQVIEDSKRPAQNTSDKIWKRLSSAQLLNNMQSTSKCNSRSVESPKKMNIANCTEHNAQYTAHRTEHKTKHRASEHRALSTELRRNNDGESQR